MECRIMARIRELKGGWQVADAEDEANYPQYVSEREVRLAIEGNPEDGYHLIMSPDGYFTADGWFPTTEEALVEAREVFGVSAADWK